jgi:formylglycine-generating enzyme required for sulfatase activity
VLLAVGVAAAAFALQETARRTAVADNLAAAERLLATCDFDAAQEAIARAVERDPESLRARELRGLVETARSEAQREARRREALAAAASARTEAAEWLQRHAEVVAEAGALRVELERTRPRVVGSYASDSDRAEFATREARLRELEVAIETDLVAAQQALERAARLETPWQGPLPETEAALAGFYVGRWREAIVAGDEARAASFRMAVERHDKTGVHADELSGHGAITISVAPAAAEVYPFRYEDVSASSQPPTVPRLVPVPTTGIGVVRAGEWCEGFGPGDACLRVVEVAAGSPAAVAGLEVGDLVIAIDGEAADGAAFLRLAPGHPLRLEGAAGLARVEALGGVRVEAPFDWHCILAQGGDASVRLRGVSRELPVDPAALAAIGAAEAAAGPAAEPLRLRCLRGGESLEFEVPPGVASGLRCEGTACPLVLAPGNRIAAGAALAAEAGSYLIVARHAGFEEQRVPLHVPRNGHPHAEVALLPAGSTPPGFVYVPPGPFRRGGDPRAFQSPPAEQAQLAGFWIARFEVDNDAYFAFLNSPGVQREIEASGNSIRLPRDGQNKVMATRRDDGSWVWSVYTSTTGKSPVLGVSWQDARAFVDWRNTEAAARGEPWVYDLPSADEWEKAARGPDGRFHPWGDRFDPSLVVCGTRKPWPLIDAPGGFEPRDESPYGVRDLGGSREEWTRDSVPQRDPNQPQSVYYKMGGSWSSTAEAIFRAASRPNAGEARVASGYGLRLVARRR